MMSLVIFLGLLVGITAAFIDNKPSVQTLIAMRNHFLKLDIDDDELIEYADLRSYFNRVDTNSDGIVDQDEIHNYHLINKIVQQNVLKVDDIDGDGVVSMKDLETNLFLNANQYGNDMDLYEYLMFVLPREGFVNVEKISNLFVTLEKNYKIVDVNDDGVVSGDEFIADFREADYDKDGVLNAAELNGVRSIPLGLIHRYCPINNEENCTGEDFMLFFTEADSNHDSILTFEEHLVKIRNINDSG